MPELIVTTREGQTRAVEGVVGHSVMETVRDAGFDEMLALCGGVCACATCHVHVDPEFAAVLPPMGPDENELLESSPHRNARSRLGCQIRLNDAMSGLRVTIAEAD